MQITCIRVNKRIRARYCVINRNQSYPNFDINELESTLDIDLNQRISDPKERGERIGRDKSINIYVTCKSLIKSQRRNNRFGF